MAEKASKKEKNQNIQVFVRLRPLNQRERDIKSLGVVEVANGREVVVRTSQQASHTKRFTFDRAFGPYAKQVEVYQEVVSPLIEEVLAGYNCTVFAYGQTGTGKTHTMVGESTGDETNWQNDPMGGIIPRALSQLFDELRLTDTEYAVRVSYLELYNEELFDLLASSHDASKLRIYEDVSRKGSNIVNGLEEVTVYNKNEVYKIMSQGQERKKVASTLMNAQSSRSHTVFTIVVHMKENSAEGEELVKVGKLNLVDLAGSENISKAGSDNPAKRERARECVNINQSLLTLGRVITALVERHPHIPYRESKLTRILQESLGGRTKTSIIATVSPGHKDLEETLSTLEYAHRAKNIQNKPEVNQKMTKKAILKQYAEEIDRLKRDLVAARDKNGVYLANETFAEMTLKQEEQRKEIQELLLRKRALEEERDRMEAVFSDHQQKLQQRESELSVTMDVLNDTKAQLANTYKMLQSTRTQFEEQKQLLEFQKQVEKELSAQADKILTAADQATSHLHYLHDAFEKRKSVEARNAQATGAFREQSARQREGARAAAEGGARALDAALQAAAHALQTHTADNIQMCEDSRRKLEEIIQNTTEAVNSLRESEGKLASEMSSSTLAHHQHIGRRLEGEGGRLGEALRALAEGAAGALHAAAQPDLPAALAALLHRRVGAAEEGAAGARAAAAATAGGARRLGARALRLCGAQADARTRHAHALRSGLGAHTQLIMEDKEYTEMRFIEKMGQMEKEQEESEARLAEWAAEERRLAEERIERHVQGERRALAQRLQRMRRDALEERREARERAALGAQLLGAALLLARRDAEQAGADLERGGREIEADLVQIDSMAREWEEAISSVTSQVHLASEDVLNEARQGRGQMVEALNEAAQNIKTRSSGLIASNKEATEALAAELASAASAVAEESARALQKLRRLAEASSTWTAERASSAESAARALRSASEAHARAQGGALGEARGELRQLSARLQEALDAQEALEERFLRREFKLSSPTGRTPLRREFRYPRRLAPRARCPSDEECAVVESECERERERDASPQAPRPVAKSGSETDIYKKHRQERGGKENAPASRATTSKKPSRLPAPSAHHTSGLHERN